MTGIDAAAAPATNEHRIEQAYRAAVATLPYCKVSVKLLCNQAGVTRKVFYRLFGGKNDVLAHVIRRDVVEPQVELCKLLTFARMGAHAADMERRMFRAIRDDAQFYRDVVTCESGGREAFCAAASRVFRDFNALLLQEYAFQGDDVEQDYVAACYADAKTQMMLKWIQEDYPLEVDVISELYSRMALPFWQGLMRA